MIGFEAMLTVAVLSQLAVDTTRSTEMQILDEGLNAKLRFSVNGQWYYSFPVNPKQTINVDKVRVQVGTYDNGTGAFPNQTVDVDLPPKSIQLNPPKPANIPATAYFVPATAYYPYGGWGGPSYTTYCLPAVYSPPIYYAPPPAMYVPSMSYCMPCQ